MGHSQYVIRPIVSSDGSIPTCGFLKIFFGLAKGFGSITDIIATTAMCYLLKSSNSGVSKQ